MLTNLWGHEHHTLCHLLAQEVTVWNKTIPHFY